MYKIDKNVPLPNRNRRVINSKYPLDLMDFGDSFLIPNSELNKWSKAPYKTAKQLNIRITTQKERRGLRVFKVRKNWRKS